MKIIDASVALALGAMLALPIAAQAQNNASAKSAPASEEPLEEVVVTARQREETLIEIPLAISAFTEEKIREAGFRDLSDVVRQTPSVDFQQRGSGLGVGGRINPVIRIRGVASPSPLPHLAATSLFVDGVFALGGANAVPINDIERIEVIKGPQSAFFGRNTFAGAINYVTRTPKLDARYSRIDLSAGNRGLYDVTLLSSFPLVTDKLAIEGNIRGYGRGSQFTATDGGGLGGEETKSGALTLFAKPTENLRIKARVAYSEDDDEMPATANFQSQLLAPNCQGRTVQGLDNAGNPATINIGATYCGEVPNPGEALAPKVTANTLLQPTSFSFVRPAFDGELNVTLPAAARPDFLIQQGILRKYLPGVPTLDGPGMRRNYLRTSLNVDYDFASGYRLSLNGGYNDQKINYWYDFDRTDVEAWWNFDPQTAKDYSVEARLSSPGDRRFRWLGGVTYYDQKFVTSGAGGLAISGCPLAAATPAAQAACLTANSIGPGNFALATTGGNLATVKAVYGSVSFDITQQLTLDVEARYLEDQRTVPLVAGTFKANFETTYIQRTPRVILSWKPSEATTLYVQASRGGLPGQTVATAAICSEQDFLVPYISPITGQPSTASECAQLAAQTPGGQLIRATPAQELDAYELGWKQAALGNKLRFNLTGYWYKWKNIPSALTVRFFRDATDPNLRDRVPNAVPNTLSVNVPGTQELYGLELESGLAVTDRWDVALNLSYNHNEWTDFSIVEPWYTLASGATANNRKGKEVPRYPAWIGSVSSTYTAPINDTWSWFVRGDANYTSKRYVDYANLAYLGAYSLVNAAVGAKRENLRVEVGVRNLFDEDTWLQGIEATDFSQFGATFSRRGIGLLPQDKRQFELRANYTF